MPVWAPPTPPQDENDLYIDYSLGFLYEQSLMSESQLPPVYIPKETNKRLRLDTTIARKQKVRKEEGFNIPRSLFDRPSTSMIKLRRELILQKLRGSAISGPESAAIHRTINALGASIALPQTNILPSQTLKSPQYLISGLHQDSIPNWAIHEDWAVLQIIQYFQDLPLSLSILSPGHTPNWDLVSDVVNLVSCNYRSPKLCKYHYETTIVPREEGKIANDSNPKQKQKKIKGTIATPTTPPITPAVSIVTSVKPEPKTTRPLRTSQLIFQDNNTSFSQLCNQRFETIKQIANKRTPTLKPMFTLTSTSKNPKHIALLSESGINYEQPLTPIQVAINRAERISREKQKAQADQALAAARQQLQSKQQQQQQQQQQQASQIKPVLASNTNIPAAHHQLQQAISAKVAALNQATLSKVSTATGIVANANATTATQLNLSKALSQVNVASLSNASQQHSLPQPILSQINVSPQTIGSTTASSPEAMSQGIQVQQPTCSVVSVAALTPQAHQKLMAAVSPAVTQMGGQPANRLPTTPQQQVYKQIFLRQQQQQQQRQQQPQHIQIQSVPQTGKQITAIGVGQQQRFQIATVTQQPVQHTQSLIATTGLKGSQPSIVTSLPVAVPMTAAQQQRISTTTTAKPTQQIITRTITTDPIQMAQIIKRQQLATQQSSGNIPQTQILLQQSATHQTQSSQPQQILQNPVTFVKTLSSPATLATQSLAIPITGMNIFTSPATKVVSPTASITSTTAAVTSVTATQLRQIQLLQKRPQQSGQVVQQQQIQTHLAQQLGQQTQQKITATIAAQAKGIAQIQASPVGTFQILHQTSASSQNVQTAKPTTIQTVTPQQLQQLQQALKQQGLMVPPNLSHTIQVTQNPATTSSATLIPQSLLQAVTQAKPAQTSQIETSPQSTPIAVAQIAPNQQTVKHIQTQSGGVAQKIIISGQPTILQTSALQHAVQSQPQTVTLAFRTANQTNVTPQTQTIPSQTTSAEIPASTSTSVLSKEAETKEQTESNQNVSQSQVRQSPYATRQRNNKTV